MSRVKYSCCYCGSENIQFDAIAEWNGEEFVLSNLMDEAYCLDCDHTSYPNREEVEDA